MRHGYEEDKVQCTALIKNGKRCHRIGHYGVGGGVLCTEHHRMAMMKKSKPTERKEK